MLKLAYGHLAVALVLLPLAAFVFLPSGAGPGALPREMGFWGPLQNSLIHIDRAKMKWTDENHKAVGDVPTMNELAPYLGEWTNDIALFAALGVTYEITPISETAPQLDVATLTRDLRFQRGFSRYYRSGTKFSLQGERFYPPLDTKSRLIDFYQNNRGLLAIVLFALAIGNLLVFVIRKTQELRRMGDITHEQS